MSPLGCSRDEAIKYLGCSETKFQELTNRKIIVRLSGGWYSYRLLAMAMETLEKEALSGAKVIYLEHQSDREEVKAGNVGSKRSRSTIRPTQELLREERERSGRKGA